MLCQRYHFGWDPHAETDKVNNKLCALVVLSCTSGLLQAEFYHAVDDRGQTVRLVRPQRAVSAEEGWLEAANNSALGRQVADIIQLSIKMYGRDGPLGYQTGYAPCFAALGGLNALVGHAGETPAGMNIRYGDSTVGAAAALAIVAALHHRETSGEGQFIDLSAVETLSMMVGDSLFAYGLTGELPQATGNLHADMAPHGCYPCADGQWISLAIADDREWAAFCATIGAQALATDPRFADAADRLANRNALDAALAGLSPEWDAEAMAQALLLAGVPAFRSQSSLDLIGSEALWALGAYRMVSDAKGEPRPIIGPGWRMTPDEASITRGAPLLGEHNHLVYSEILGLSDSEIDDLIARRVIW